MQYTTNNTIATITSDKNTPATCPMVCPLSCMNVFASQSANLPLSEDISPSPIEFSSNCSLEPDSLVTTTQYDLLPLSSTWTLIFFEHKSLLPSIFVVIEDSIFANTSS